MTTHADMHAPIPEDLLEAFFDHELDPAGREKFFQSIRGDLQRCAEVAKTQRMISMLREPLDSPDLTEDIMGELRARGAFVPARTRRLVWSGRWAAAAALVVGVLGIALAQRYAPDSLRLVPKPKPVSQVISSSSSEAVTGVQKIAGAMNIVSARIVEPEGAPGAAKRRGMISLQLSPGKTSVKLPGSGGGAIVVYTGSGSERFVLPEGMYLDRSTAMVLPLGYISPTRAGQDWVAISPENPFLLPSVKPTQGQEEPAMARVRVTKP
jgi:hypothetical protein